VEILLRRRQIFRRQVDGSHPGLQTVGQMAQSHLVGEVSEQEQQVHRRVDEIPRGRHSTGLDDLQARERGAKSEKEGEGEVRVAEG
jgi:hypothetical protein